MNARIMRGRCALGLTVALAASAALAPFPARAADTCSAATYRQFDFWLGTWDVYDPQNQLAGTNTVTSEYGGCVLQEHWRGAGGMMTGSSFNIYDARAKRWHQTWVDSGGSLLQLDGGFSGGAMRLRGSRIGRDGKPVRDTIEWTPNADGTVRQLWRASRDGGRTWRTVFDGRYVKRPG